MQSIFNTSYIETIQIPLLYNFKIDILRDDTIHPIVCGNKWRKLKYLIAHCIENKIEGIVTYGGAYSNHLVATAFAGNHYGLKTIGFVRGSEYRELNSYEQICIENNMKLIHVSRESFRQKNKLFESLNLPENKWLNIAEGGDSEWAVTGCEEILDDLKVEYDYIFLSAGTGTSAEGIVRGIVKRNLSTKVIVISSLKNNTYLDERLSKYPLSNWQVEHHYHRGKYAKTDNLLFDFMQQFKVQTNFKLEPIYTGKMFLALQDFIQNNKIKTTDRVLAIHTGGLLQFY